LVAVLSALPVLICKAISTNGDPSTMKNGDIDVALDLAVEQRRDGLKIRYSVHNRGPADIVLFNRLGLNGLDGRIVYSPDFVYIDYESGSVHFRKMALPLPERTRIETRDTPEVIRLPGGQAFSEEFFAREPIAVRNPMKSMHVSSLSPDRNAEALDFRSASEARVSIGFIPVDSAMTFVSTCPEYPETSYCFTNLDNQVVLSKTVRLDRSVVVVDYSPGAPLW
jgi:hypothetical protein